MSAICSGNEAPRPSPNGSISSPSGKVLVRRVDRHRVPGRLGGVSRRPAGPLHLGTIDSRNPMPRRTGRRHPQPSL